MKEEQSKENIVLFPGVVEKLVTKGMDALKEKRFEDALSNFEQALEIQPDHPQGRFGVALSLIEQSRLQEAKEATAKMLKEDIGNYYDILQVHISLLVQLGHYDEVVTMLEAIMAEEKLPSHLAESFYHLLHFSRQMVDDCNIELDDDGKDPPEDLLCYLHNGSKEKQWLAIQMLGKALNGKTIEAFKDYLKNKQHDPILKSIVLQYLKDYQVDENIEIHKFGKVIKMNTAQLEDVFHKKFGEDTVEFISDQLEHENPSLFEVVSQICWHYLFAIYPTSPQPMEPKLWAAALHSVGEEMTGQDPNLQQIASQYGVNDKDIVTCIAEIQKIENDTYKGTI